MIEIHKKENLAMNIQNYLLLLPNQDNNLLLHQAKDIEDRKE